MKNQLLEVADKLTAVAQWPEFRTGDTLRVHYTIKEGAKERVQVFEGLCIRFKKGTANQTFTVRKVVADIGVERIFPYHSPFISNIEVVRTGKVRQSRIYYMRALRGKAARIKERK